MSDDRRRELEAQLSAYLDDELGLDERREVEARLAVDEGARELLKELRATVEAVRGLPRARASENLVESLRARMERQSLLESRPVSARATGGGRSYLKWMAAAAIVGLTVASGYLMWPLAREHFNRPGQQYAMRGEHKSEVEPPVLGLRDSAESGDFDRSADAPAAAPSPTPPADHYLGRGVARESAEDSRDGVLSDTRRRSEAPAAPAAERRQDDKQPTVVARKGRMVTSRVESQSGAEDDAALAGAKTQRVDEFARRDRVAGDKTVEGLASKTTVLEATFASAAHRREAVGRLQDEYAFRRIAPAEEAGEAAAALEVWVPDEESARRVVKGVQQSLSSGDVLVIGDGLVSNGAAKPDGGTAPAGMVAEGASHEHRKGTDWPASVGEEAKSISDPSKAEAVRRGARNLVYGLSGGRWEEQSGGYGAYRSSADAASLTSSAPAAAASPARPNQPAEVPGPGAATARRLAVNTPAGQPATAPALLGAGWHAAPSTRPGGLASADSRLRIYVHVGSAPASGPAAESRPAAGE